MIKEKQQFIGAIALLVGTAVGAGIFGIPYVVSQVGFRVGSVYIIALGLTTALITLAYGEVVLRTKKRQQMSGYAETYVGLGGKRIVALSLIFGITGALIAYIIEVGNFLHAMLNSSFGGEPLTYSLIFFALAATTVYVGLKAIVSIEKFMISLLLLVTAVFIAIGFPSIDLVNLSTSPVSLASLFAPYGVILFAFGAGTAVPNMADIFKNDNYLKPAIITGMLFPMIIYLLFAFVVVGITGINTSESAIIGLGQVLGPTMLTFGAIFGILTMTTSFLALGLVLRELYEFDYKIPKPLSWLLVMAIPLIIVLFKLTSFIEIIGLTGGIMGGFDGIIILLMWQAAKKAGNRSPEYTIDLHPLMVNFLFLVFGLGIVYQVYYLIAK